MATGTNGCENPQLVCPRNVGEGYAKCKTVCQQGDHAERDALREARAVGLTLAGAYAILTGHYWMCEECGRALAEAGVMHIDILPTL